MLQLSTVYYFLGNLGQAFFIRSCHEDVIFTRKSHNCAGTAFVHGDSVGGSKLTEQNLIVLFYFVNIEVNDLRKTPVLQLKQSNSPLVV